MLFIKIYILYIVLITVITGIQSLVQSSTVEDGKIMFDEPVIKHILNKLFNALNIHLLDEKPRVKQLFKMHNNFESITLTYCNSLKEIVELLKVNNTDNNIKYLIAKVNEVLDINDKNIQFNKNDSNIEKYTENLIRKLKRLKKRVSSEKFDINTLSLNDVYKNQTTRINTTGFNNSMETKEEKGQEQILNEDDYFWKPSGRRIFKGYRTRIKNFPFMASVQFFKKFQCAGSIIKSDLVITSASCLQLSYNNRFFRENPAYLSVQIGSDFYENGGENIAVQEIYFYPSYDPKTLKNNLAIMRLSRRISFRKKHKRVRKIDIDRSPSAWIPYSGYELVTVIGWGARDHSNIIYNPWKNKLAYAELEYYPLRECQKYYSREYVTRKNFCAGFFSKGGGACNRDAGGPAVIGGILLGVISYGSPVCGLPDSPTVFTKLGFYTHWIDNILEQKVPFKFKRTTTLAPIMRYDFTKKFTTELVFKPITTQKSIALDSSAVLNEPREYIHNDFLPEELDNKEVNEYLDQIKPNLENTRQQNVTTNKKQEAMIARDIRVTAIVPVNEPTVETENNLDLQESNDVNSNSLSMETDANLENTRHQNVTTNIKQETMIARDIRVTAIVPVKEPTVETENNLDLQESNDVNSNSLSLETDAKAVTQLTLLENVDKRHNFKNDIRMLIDHLEVDKLMYDTLKEFTTEGPNKSKGDLNDEERTSVNHLFSSDKEGVGFNIAMEPFQNLPSKVTRNNTYNNLLEPKLLNIVSQAVEEEIKEHVRKTKEI